MVVLFVVFGGTSILLSVAVALISIPPSHPQYLMLPALMFVLLMIVILTGTFDLHFLYGQV
jgi:FtsH-binding integral membrane protein